MSEIEWTSGLVHSEHLHPLKKESFIALSVAPVQMGPLKMQEIIEMNMATDRLNPPQNERFHIGRETWYPPQYEATMVKESDESTKGNVAVILLPGITVSGTQFSHIAESMFEEAKKDKELLGGTNGEIGLVSILSSSVSVDTMNKSFSDKPLQRGAYQALFIKRMLEDNPTITHVHLAGQSMGAAELPYVTLMLKEMLKDTGIAIEGMTLIQPGGHMEQGITELIAGMPDVMSKPDELAFFFPSPLGKWAVQQTTRRETLKNFSTPQFNQYEVLPELTGIDTQIQQIIKDKEYTGPVCDFPMREGERPGNWKITRKERRQLRKLLNERKKVINPLLKDYTGYDARGNTLTVSVLLRMRKALGFLTKPPPDWVRTAMDVPVTIVIGSKDQYFPSGKFIERNRSLPIYSAKAKEITKYLDWAHQANDVSPTDFARMVIAACARKDFSPA